MKISFVSALAVVAVMWVAPAADARRYPEYAVTLPYTAPAGVRQGQPNVVLAPVVEGRENASLWLGAIRNQFGVPLRILVTEAPHTEIVGQAFHDALAARGMANESGAYRIAVRIVRFDCNQIFPKEAYVTFSVRVENVSSGAVLYETTSQVSRASSGGTGAIFGTPPLEPLRDLINQVLNEAVDRALDDPGLRAAIGETAPPSEAPTPAAEAPAPAASPTP